MSSSPHSPEPSPDDHALPESTPVGDYDAAGVPTFEHVRDKIEGRYATSLGSTELADESEAGRTIAQQEADREAAAKERLEQIRRSVRGDG